MYGLHIYHALVDLDSSGWPGVRPRATPGLTLSTQIVCVCASITVYTRTHPLSTPTPAKIEKYTRKTPYLYPCQNVAATYASYNKLAKCKNTSAYVNSVASMVASIYPSVNNNCHSSYTCLCTPVYKTLVWCSGNFLPTHQHIHTHTRKHTWIDDAAETAQGADADAGGSARLPRSTRSTTLSTSNARTQKTSLYALPNSHTPRLPPSFELPLPYKPEDSSRTASHTVLLTQTNSHSECRLKRLPSIMLTMFPSPVHFMFKLRHPGKQPPERPAKPHNGPLHGDKTIRGKAAVQKSPVGEPAKGLG